jgi:hypothetical protein
VRFEELLAVLLQIVLDDAPELLVNDGGERDEARGKLNEKKTKAIRKSIKRMAVSLRDSQEKEQWNDQRMRQYSPPDTTTTRIPGVSPASLLLF